MLGHSFMVPHYDLGGLPDKVSNSQAGGCVALKPPRRTTEERFRAWGSVTFADCQMLTSMKTAAWSEAAWLELVMPG